MGYFSAQDGSYEWTGGGSDPQTPNNGYYCL